MLQENICLLYWYLLNAERNGQADMVILLESFGNVMLESFLH